MRRGIALLVAGLALAAPGSASAAKPPNIIVVMSDDQPYWSVKEMPYTSSLRGLKPFRALYDNFALCCPARATFLTGLYSHHTGVETNDGSAFDDSSTLATWLDDAGYETGLFGKYLNGYPFGQGPEFIPPGWDRWVTFQSGEGRYFDFNLNIDGGLEGFGSAPGDYSTDVLGRYAHRFVKRAPRPFFALVATRGPHSPFTPAPRHVGVSPPLEWPARSNFGRAANGAPEFYAGLPEAESTPFRARARRQADTLLSIDELNETLVRAANRRGGAIFLYWSDNGLSLGSHNLGAKRCAYEECGRVPGLIRGAGDPRRVLASNADLAPTLAELAGVDSPPTDGESLVDELDGERQARDHALLLRNAGNAPIPAFWGVRTRRWKYIEHSPEAGQPGIELYDLKRDPFELRNKHGKPEYAEREEALHDTLEELRSAPPSG